MRIDFNAKRFPCKPVKESLGVPFSEFTLLGKNLAFRQEREVLMAGGSWVDDDNKAQLWVREDAMVTKEAISHFVKSAHELSENVKWQSGGRTGHFVDEILMGDDEPLLLWLPNGGPVTQEILNTAKELRVDVKEQLFNLPVPKSQFGVDFIELPLTDFIVLPTRHWLQLLWANLLGLGPFLWRQLVGSNPFTALWNFCVASFHARSMRPSKIFPHLRKKGKRVKIHPSAVVEGCWIGDDVEIGANAVVRGSVISDGARIEDLALVEFSVLGNACIVQRQAMVKFSLLGPFSAAAGVIQLGVLDKNASLKRGAYLMDMNMGTSRAKVSIGGKLQIAPLGLAGCCVGMNTTIGLGVHVAAGRYLPSDLDIVSDPKGILLKVPDNAKGLMTVKNGGLSSS